MSRLRCLEGCPVIVTITVLQKKYCVTGERVQASNKREHRVKSSYFCDALLIVAYFVTVLMPLVNLTDCH